MNGTEMLMELMTRFNRKGEPTAIVVVYTYDNDVYLRSNCVHTHTIGMAEHAKQEALTALKEGNYKPWDKPDDDTMPPDDDESKDGQQ
jgi:hypothetical protein